MSHLLAELAGSNSGMRYSAEQLGEMAIEIERQAENTAIRIAVTLPFPGFPEWGRHTVRWGRGASGAVARTASITAREAKSLDRAKVSATKGFYEAVFKKNPKNLAAAARVKLMERILELMGGD